jgi:hypothetical protein
VCLSFPLAHACGQLRASRQFLCARLFVDISVSSPQWPYSILQMKKLRPREVKDIAGIQLPGLNLCSSLDQQKWGVEGEKG